MATIAKSVASVVDKTTAQVLWFREVGIGDVGLVGGKNASLGEMIQHLSADGIRVPNGFATTAFAYRRFLQASGLDVKLQEIFAGLDPGNLEDLRERGKQVRGLILAATFPQDLEELIAQGYAALCREYGPDTDVAVRSSATAEDLPDASFAGQHETFLNVHGITAVLEACKKSFASMFTDRAINYRHEHGFDHMKIALSVGVQKMVRSDLAGSGVMFSIDTETGFPNVVLINAAFGLGENIVQGSVNPDEYLVFKPTLQKGFRPVLRRRLGSKEFKLIYEAGGTKSTRNVPVSIADRRKFVLTDDEVLELARWACRIEEHYTRAHGMNTPMDIEWAKDGLTNQLYIVQARPETVQSQKKAFVVRTYRLEAKGPILATGRSVGEAIGQGAARVILNPADGDSFKPGEVLITQRTDPDWEPIMKRAAAVVTDEGGRTCHAAIVARELGIPAVVGTDKGTTAIKPGTPVTVSCAEGEAGFVYAGALPFSTEEIPLPSLPHTRTQIMMNVGNPEDAFRLQELPNQGVGLARVEFIIANQIQVHPMALVHFDRIKDPAVQARLADLTAGYADKTDYFVEQLAQGVGTIAAAFYPRPVIVRLSDFKTNEYASLLGGKDFEPAEENPMIGWRGASRYYHPDYRDGFALECRAMRRVREDMGLTNVVLMVPFCRTPQEGRAVLAEMAKHGLERGKNGLEVYVMCEIPSNVILADEFCEIFDGFSIGSNDLTQLTLGLDRDSRLVASLFDERNEAVRKMIVAAIKATKKNGRKIGICGQAPSDYPEFAEFLVEQGIDSISLNPDSVVKTLLNVARTERRAMNKST